MARRGYLGASPAGHTTDAYNALMQFRQSAKSALRLLKKKQCRTAFHELLSAEGTLRVARRAFADSDVPTAKYMQDMKRPRQILAAVRSGFTSRCIVKRMKPRGRR
jgi:hypothetical protein